MMAVSLLAWAFTPALWALIIVLASLALAGGVLGVALDSALTKSVYPEEVGDTRGGGCSSCPTCRVRKLQRGHWEVSGSRLLRLRLWFVLQFML